MTHELVLTSVTQGLEPDRRGFGIVAADQRIPPSLVKRLQSISGFRECFPPGSEQYSHHPIGYSHLIVPTPDAGWHVLSRIAPTGWDFQHDPNRLVHHVAFQDDERVEEGPAWLLGLYGFHFTEWITPPVRFARGRPIPTLTAPPPMTRRQRIARERTWLDPAKMALSIPASEEPETLRALARENEEQLIIAGPPSTPCATWQEITGDAAWGGILADTIRTGQTAAIIYRPGMNILPLFVESLSLLPREQLWKATFTTYYTGLPEYLPCQWKGMVADSEEAIEQLRNGDCLILDLTRPMGEAPTGLYVDYARHGIENMLPKNEFDDTVFQDNDFDSQAFRSDLPETVTLNSSEHSTSREIESTVGLSSASDGSPPFIDHNTVLETASDSDPMLVPPIQPPKRITIRQSNTSGKTIDSLLNMRSKSQFYLLYGTTLILVVFLLLLVLDQFVDFGLARWFQGVRQTTRSAGATTGEKESETASNDTSRGTGESRKLSDEQIQRERQRLEKERQAEIRTAERRKRQLKEQAEKARQAMREKKRTAANELSEFLLDFSLPVYLDFKVPAIEKNMIMPPQPQLFPECASLYRFGLALELKLLPLLDIPNLRVETEKLELYRPIDKTDADAPSSPSPSDDPGSSSSKLDEPAENSQTSDQPVFADESDESRIPDDSKFEWMVRAVDTETLDATPMFHLKLTEAGLTVHWIRDGMEPQRFYDTLWASLAFLRVSGEEEKDLSKIKSIALFQPTTVSPFFLSKEFGDPEKSEVVVSTPFAREPWKTLWEESTPPPYSLRLETTVIPDVPVGIEGTEIVDDLPPAQFFVNFQTGVFSKRNVAANQDQFSPVVIPMEGVADPSKIVWSDRYKDRMTQLNDEFETGKIQYDELKKEEEAVRQQVFNEGTKAPRELRTKRNELSEETKKRKSRLDEIESILANLPSAHQKILDNKELRFDYSLYLIPDNRQEQPPASGEPEKEKEVSLENQADDAIAEDPSSIAFSEGAVTGKRLRSEEALLLLRTSTEAGRQKAPSEATAPTEASTLSDSNEEPSREEPGKKERGQEQGDAFSDETPSKLD